MFDHEPRAKAHELSVDQWFNTDSPITLNALLGRPVLIHTFQMLCPGCVAHTLPQMKRVYELFGKGDLAVLGLHTVFEHHDAMTPTALKAFIHEYKLTFPIGIDRPSQTGPTPQTMTAYGLRGTPSTLLIDRSGHLVLNAFGHIDDLALGAMIQSVLSGAEDAPALSGPSGTAQGGEVCDENRCVATPHG